MRIGRRTCELKKQSGLTFRNQKGLISLVIVQGHNMVNPPVMGRLLVLSLIGVTFLPFSELPWMSAVSTPVREIRVPDITQEGNTSPLIKDNTVVFLSLSKADYKALVNKRPGAEDELAEVLSDFYFYAEQVADLLKSHGISSEFKHWKELQFLSVDGNIIRKTIDPDDPFGLALYAKGKDPLMVRPFGTIIADIESVQVTPDFASMAAVISEYFGIKL